MTDKELEGAPLAPATIRARGIKYAHALREWMSINDKALMDVDTRTLRAVIRLLAQISRKQEKQ